MAPEADHQHPLEEAGGHAEPGEFVPAMGFVLAVADDAAADVPGEEKIVSSSIWHRY